MTGKLIVALAVLTSQLAHAKPPKDPKKIECALPETVIYTLEQVVALEAASVEDLKLGGTASPTSAPTWEGVDICHPVRSREDAKRARDKCARRLGEQGERT